MNQVWDRTNGHVVFLEEDHVVTVDFIVVLKLLTQHACHGVPSCWGFALSPYYSPARLSLNMTDEKNNEFQYIYGFMNTGYSFSKNIWKQIYALSIQFHDFQDGWDVSLYHLMHTGLLNKTTQLLPRISRVRNIGKKGINITPKSYNDIGIGMMRKSHAIGIGKKHFSIEFNISGDPPTSELCTCKEDGK